MRRVILALVLLVAVLPARADADPWYRGKYAHNRLVHLGVTGGLGAYLLVSSLTLNGLTATSCRWCDPPAFDRAARRALVWGNTRLADSLSNYETYLLAPLVGLSLLIVSDSDASAARLIDDLLPAAETVAIVQIATQFAKYAFARERPGPHFAAPGTVVASGDNYSSFWSGHSVLGLAITSAAGTVCHLRHYWTEPYVWGAGLALSISTEYFRVAADRHYLSDVVAGGLVGLGAGLLVPRLMQRDLKLVPLDSNGSLAGAVAGMAVAGTF